MFAVEGLTNIAAPTAASAAAEAPDENSEAAFSREDSDSEQVTPVADEFESPAPLEEPAPPAQQFKSEAAAALPQETYEPAPPEASETVAVPPAEGEQLSLSLPQREESPPAEEPPIPEQEEIAYSPHPNINPREIRIPRKLTDVEPPMEPLAPPHQELLQSSIPPLGAIPLPSETSAWTSLAILAMPILAFLAVMTLLAYGMASSGPAVLMLARAVLPSMPDAAPVDLVVQGVELKKMTLDSGDSVWLVSGEVRNYGKEPVKDIEIEAAAFNAANNLVVREKVPLSTILLRSRIHSLSVQLLQSLQHEPTKRVPQLRPNDKSQFAIALIGPDLAQGRFLAARIYSVKRS